MLKKEFNKLKQVWYKKLKKSGFEDIELNEKYLKNPSSKFLRKRSLDTFQNRENYYYMATCFLNDYKFKTRLDKIVWEYHANGISVRNIVMLLKTVKIRCNRDSICKKTQELRKIMEQLYLPEYSIRKLEDNK